MDEYEYTIIEVYDPTDDYDIVKCTVNADS